MNTAKQVSPHISPQILGNIATLYTDPNRVILEYIDNSIDSAEYYFDRKEDTYSKPIEISVEHSGTTGNNGSIVIADNCTGMDGDGLLRIIREIGNSAKKEQPWTNGQFGYGIYSFMAICKSIEVVSKLESKKPQIVKLDRKDFDTECIDDVKITIPRVCDQSLFECNSSFIRDSGTKVTLKHFDNTHWKQISVTELRQEIEKHFELLLLRPKLRVSLAVKGFARSRCTSFNYDAYSGDYYDDRVFNLSAKHKKRQTKHYPLSDPIKVFIKMTDGKDIGKRPVVMANGRRIAEVTDLKSFPSSNKHAIWNHPYLTGYIDVQGFLGPTIARADFKNTDKSKAFFTYLRQIESLIQDLIDSNNKTDEERHYRELENALNKALSQVAKLDNMVLQHRTEVITGDEFALEEGAVGRGLTDNELGARDRLGGSNGSGDGVGENEGDGVGLNDEGGDRPGGNPPGESPQNRELEDPFGDSEFAGRRTKKGGFNVRIVDRLPDKIKDPRTGETIDQRSSLAGDTIEIFKQHPDFQERITKARTGAHKINQRLITFLAGEMTIHYKDMFHNKMGQPEYNKWMFIDLTSSIYLLEGLLKGLVGMHLSEFANND